MTMPAPARAIAAAFAHWSTLKSGSTTSGTPCAQRADGRPVAAVADDDRGLRQDRVLRHPRSTCTFAGSGPSSPRSRGSPTVTSSRIGSGASASIAPR